ncbi:MAG: CRTAC1 family protein, partial [Myxococcota bacterium]
LPNSTAREQRNQLFIQDGGTFYHLANQGPESALGFSRGVSSFDADRDGDIDLLVSNLARPPLLLNNIHTPATTTHRWIQIRLVGRGKNTHAIGAQLALKAGDTTMRRLITGSIGFMGQQETIASFGLGEQDWASLTIHWPDGTTQSLPKLAANTRHTITQAP